MRQRAGQGSGAAADLEAFIARWGTSAGAERANYRLFLAELCDLLGVPRPEPSVADEAANRYVCGLFKHAKAPRVEEILDTLVALGHARRTDTGYTPA